MRIANATHKTLSLARALKGKTITIKVTGTEAGYRTLTKTSKSTKPVAG